MKYAQNCFTLYAQNCFTLYAQNCFTLYNILGSSSNDDGDGNEDVKKAIGLY